MNSKGMMFELTVAFVMLSRAEVKSMTVFTHISIFHSTLILVQVEHMK